MIIVIRNTWIHRLITSLHNGPVYTRYKPSTHNATVQQSQDAVAQPHDDIIKEEKVVKVVEGLPAKKR